MRFIARLRVGWLAVALAGLGLAGVVRFMTPTRDTRPRGVTVWLEDVPLGGALVLPEEGVAVTRTLAGATFFHAGHRMESRELMASPPIQV